MYDSKEYIKACKLEAQANAILAKYTDESIKEDFKKYAELMEESNRLAYLAQGGYID